MATKLGNVPNRGEIVVTRGADWVCTLTDSGANWPIGTACWIDIGEYSYDAVIDPFLGTASFVVQSDVCDAWAKGTKFTMFLQLPGSPTTEHAWFIGSVARADA